MIKTIAKLGDKILDKADAGIRDGISATSGMVQTSKLKGRIATLESDISDMKMQIGDYFWKKYSIGETIIDETPRYFCQKIEEIVREIEIVKSEGQE